MISQRNITLFLATALFVATSLVAEQPSITPAQPVTSVQQTGGFTKQQVLDLINQIGADLPYMPPKLAMLLEQINESSSDASLEQNLEKAVTKLLAIKIKPEQREQLKKIQAMLFKKMQNYKASSPSFAADWNSAFFVDTQDPRFTVTYKDAVGNTRQRTYQADISLIGFNIELALRLNLIFFVGTDFNFHESNKVIELGRGIQISPIAILSLFSDFFSPVRPLIQGELARIHNPLERIAARIMLAAIGHKNLANLAVLSGEFAAIDELMYALSLLNLTYIPFKNVPGGMVIIGATFGMDRDYISMVTGGTLTPVVEAS